MAMLRTLVAGGGIGGLAAALAVAHRGHHAVVLERRDEFTELGAGIQLAPNAFAALDSLGVGAAVRDRAVFIDALVLMDGTTDRTIARMPLTGAYRARFKNPYAVVHRGDLYDALLTACQQHPRIELLPGRQVDRYEQDADRVTVDTAGGDRFTGDVLIAADGIRSAVRARLLDDGPPRLSGHTIHRSVIPMSEVPEDLRWNTVTLWAGPKWHFVHYPIGGGEFLNLAATRDDGADQALVGVPVPREEVVTGFPELGETARRLLELGDEWRSWVLADRDPVDRWTDGRVALLGDAAHPMLQYAAQGACQALEDAVVLGAALDCTPPEVADRLLRYNAARRDRTGRAQRAARWMGAEIYHPSGEAAAARNRLLGGFTPDELFDQVSWLHGETFGDAGIRPSEGK